MSVNTAFNKSNFILLLSFVFEAAECSMQTSAYYIRLFFTSAAQRAPPPLQLSIGLKSACVNIVPKASTILAYWIYGNLIHIPQLLTACTL
jgi:hypothetical protein